MTKTASGKQFKIGALLSYIAIFINIASALLYTPWMLDQIGSDNYGLYNLAVTLINMFMLDFGISSAVSRFVSKYLAEDNQEAVDRLLGVVYKLFIGISAIISVVLLVVYFFVDAIYVALTPEEIEKFKVVYVISALYSVVALPLNTTVNGILNSYERFIAVKLCDVLHKLVTVALIVFALFFGYGLYALVAINAVSNLLFLLIKLLIIKIKTPVKIDFSCRDMSLLKEIFSFSVWVIVNSICSRLIMNICPNILGITAGTVAITIFSFAGTIEGYSYTFASAIDGMFMPKIARITYGDEKQDSNALLKLMTRVGRFQYHLVALIVVGFACVGGDFITLWVGGEYIEAYYCAILLLLPAPFYLSQQIGKNAMVMTNNVRYLSIVNIIKAAINIAFAALLSIWWGALGAAISISVAYTFRNIANMVLYQKKLKLDMKRFCIDCYGKMSIPIVLTLALGLLTAYYVDCNSWLILVGEIIVITVLYLCLMWLIGYNKSEKSTIKSILKKIIKRK